LWLGEDWQQILTEPDHAPLEKFQKQQEQYEKLAESLRKKMNVQVMMAPTASEGSGAPQQPATAAPAPAGPVSGPT